MNALFKQRGNAVRALSVLQGINRHGTRSLKSYKPELYRKYTKKGVLSEVYRDADLQSTITTTASPSFLSSVIPKTISATNVKFFSHNYEHDLSIGLYTYRSFYTSARLYDLESTPKSSKVDKTVQQLKTKQKEKVDEIMKEVATGKTPVLKTGADASADVSITEKASGAGATKEVSAEGTKAVTSSDKQIAEVSAPKKSIKERVWEELVHYYHGFRLLFIDAKISSKLLWRVLNGKTLTRRENKLLLRTTSDLFRLLPFSVFVIVPFMELLLPLFLKFFPGMLPSTFQTAKEREDKLRQSLAVRLEMAKFLQRTLDEMPVQHRDHSSEEAKEFEDFFKDIKNPSAFVSNDDIIKFAKRFDDEITLDSLSREQLAALCRVLELNTIGTTQLLRFQLRLKLRSLIADDRVIAREGVDSLDLFELQQACKARGMRAYGLTAERLRFQLKEWIDLSLNEKVPPTLLLLSRTMLISDDSITTDKLKETMRVLPDSVAAQTKHAISEREGKVDNKTKIEVLKEEERKIREEREEEREEITAKLRENMNEKEKVEVHTPMVAKVKEILETAQAVPPPIAKPNQEESESGISTSDVMLLKDALKTLSSDKKLIVEKEAIKELKEELRDYKEDIEELHEVRQVVKEPVHESRAAKLLYNRVNKMISSLDTVLTDLEKKQEVIKKTDACDFYTARRKDLVLIDELVETIKRVKESNDDTKFKIVENMLVNIDNDKDGLITVNQVQEVVKALDKDNKIDKRTLEEFVTLLSKQAKIRQQEEIVRIDELMQNIKKLKETSDEARLKHIESVLDKFDANKDGIITINEILKVLESISRDNIKLEDKQIEELISLLEKEEIFHAEQKIEKAIAKSIKEAERLKTSVMSQPVTGETVREIKDIAQEMSALEKAETLTDISADLIDKAKTLSDDASVELKDPAKVLQDKAKVLKDGKNLEDKAKSMLPSNKIKSSDTGVMPSTTKSNGEQNKGDKDGSSGASKGGAVGSGCASECAKNANTKSTASSKETIIRQTNDDLTLDKIIPHDTEAADAPTSSPSAIPAAATTVPQQQKQKPAAAKHADASTGAISKSTKKLL